QPGTFLDQAMSSQPPEPVIESLPGTFRLFQPHELVQLIAGDESRSQDLLQQRDVPRWAQFHGSFFVTHRPFLTLPGLPFPAEGRRTRTASWKAPRKTCPVPRGGDHAADFLKSARDDLGPERVERRVFGQGAARLELQ